MKAVRGSKHKSKGVRGRVEWWVRSQCDDTAMALSLHQNKYVVLMIERCRSWRCFIKRPIQMLQRC
eukprot:scaffold164604_cov61-Attheya_sp.AAC.1